MQRHIARQELVERLMADLPDVAEKAADDSLMASFAQAILRRVDDRYLFRHRLTTLGAQLVESFNWTRSVIGTREVQVRAFSPQSDEHGYELEGTVLETLMPDQPFIVDTLRLFMREQGVEVFNALNVIFQASVDDSGQVTDFNPKADDARHFSYTRWYVDWPSSRSLDELSDAVKARLNLVRSMVREFHRMVRAVKLMANEFDYLAKVVDSEAGNCCEVRDFLEWLVDDNFIFMGLSFYEPSGDGVAVRPVRGMGTMSGVDHPSGQRTDQTLSFLSGATLSWPLARVRKSDLDSNVHRAGKIDEIVIQTFDDQVRSTGGVVIHGMFTYKGLAAPGSEIPILRRKVQSVFERQGTVEGSYDHKSLINAFNALPVEYLFEAAEETIEDLLELSLKADTTREIQSQVVVNQDAFSAYAFVVLPKEHFSDELRQTLQRRLKERLGANYTDHRIYLGKFGSIALHFFMTSDKGFAGIDMRAVEAELIELGTPWSERLRERLETDLGEAAGAKLFARYANGFSEGYQEYISAEEAVVDIHHLERVAETGRMRFDLFQSSHAEGEALLRIYSRDEVLLTDILPVIDNFGVVVIEQFAFDISPRARRKLVVNTLRIERGAPDVLEQADALIDALRAVFAHKMRSDRLNRLLLRARLNWKQVDLFRAYASYSRQLGIGFDYEVMQRILMKHADFVHTLSGLFRLRFSPDLALDDSGRDEEIAALTEQLRDYLKGVNSFEEDRVLTTFKNLVESTIRTNFYVDERRDGEHFLSVKIRSALINEMPEPRPMFEIFVHHAKVEGIHLRGGEVARGGLRWSDRIDDYRSEVLGLMATQMLKNTLIIPVGAKGGFVLKDAVEEYSVARRHADELYKIFIRGLLEVTDNIVDGQIVPPPRVLRHDGADPYLVVAADKGTAHLSDTANAVAKSFDFWLGDAFASGGSVGYDHKEKGITARGAWVCVRRHFLEMGIDPEKDPITAVGIGDMSGDVFGNGLLLSKTIKLIGAFNHRHIFIDPKPDPEASWNERKRLFELPRSQWTDYDAKLISKGGGVYDRGAKAIQLSPEARKRLDTDLEVLSGEELIRLILKADVDLNWIGGIGTYIKAAAESHLEVDDKDNDRVRVDAEDLRCKVLGEGGNLGITMKARVAFAELGGRCNLDATDNSGGVDLSDHEVNLKILFQPEVAAGRLTGEARNKLLVELGDQVCDTVLDNNEAQSMAISLDEIRSRREIWRFVRAMEFLKRHIGFSRHGQVLPKTRDLIEQRIARNQGFVRPELAKLLSYSKMFAYRGLKEEPPGTREELIPFVRAYFPKAVVEGFGEAIDSHMLFDDIAATMIVNRIVDVAGVAFFPELCDSVSSRPVSDVAAAYLIVDDLLGASELRESLKSADDPTPIDGLYRALIRLEEGLALGTHALLATVAEPVRLRHREQLAPARAVVDALRGKLLNMLPTEGRSELRERARRLVKQGVSKSRAARVAELPTLAHAFRIGHLAHRHGLEPKAAAELFFTVGYASRVLPLVDRVSQQAYTDSWDQRAIASIRRAMLRRLRELTELLAAHQMGPQQIHRIPEIDSFGREIAELLRDHIPVAATFVLSERLRQQIQRVQGRLGSNATTAA